MHLPSLLAGVLMALLSVGLLTCGVLADAGFDLARAKQLTAGFAPEVLAPVLDRLAAALSVTRLVEVIESSSRRISQLVKEIVHVSSTQNDKRH